MLLKNKIGRKIKVWYLLGYWLVSVNLCQLLLQAILQCKIKALTFQE